MKATPGDPSGAVVLTRLLVFRNFPGFPFPVSATPNQCAAAAAKALDWLAAAGFPPAAALAGLSPQVIRLLREREILPWRSAAFPGKAAFKHIAVSPGGAAWALVNEVEHLTLGRIHPGNPRPEAAVFPDAHPEPEGGWARSARDGFLASDPGRLGPGAAVEQVLHLPGLALARELSAARNYCLAAGLAFAPALPVSASSPRPADSGLFRVASTGRLGGSAAQAYADHQENVTPLLLREADRRREAFARHPDRLRARVQSAWDKLIASPTLSYPELLAYASTARLGADLGLLDPGIGRILETLRAAAAAGHLAVSHEGRAAPEDEDFSRANVVRLSLGMERGKGT